MTTVVEGYASLWGVADLNHDVVEKGAFGDTLARRGPGGVKMLHQHEGPAPVGVWDEIREDERGLFVRGRLLEAVPQGRMVGHLVRAGAVDGLSIGFRATRSGRDGSGRLRLLKAVDLWEISLVTFPMLPGARLKVAG